LKSDRADASMIAEYAMRNYDRAVMYEPLSEALTQLRELFLYRQMVVRHRCSFQVRRGEKKLTISVVDVVAVLTDSANPQIYWRVLKNRLTKEGNETVTNCNALKMLAADGKMRKQDWH